MIIVKNTSKINFNKKFVFITSSYNQCQFVRKSLDSIRIQKYPKDKYRVVYVNDASTDKTEEYVKKFIEDNKDINMKLITNEKNLGPSYSRYIAYKDCIDNEICVFLDGDDWLVEPNTLGILSYVYSTFTIYNTFGSMLGETWQFKCWTLLNRKSECFPHLRTAYAFLCKRIPLNYLKYKNKEWFKHQTDIAFFASIVELSNYKYAFIRNEFLRYNRYSSKTNKDTGFNCMSRQQRLRRILYKIYIQNLRPLNPLIR